MQIVNIASMRNYGLFTDYNNSQTKDFGKHNVIFGWNYSGKTTLSRIFRSLETHKQVQGFENGKFRLNLEDNKNVTEIDIPSNTLKIRVFNVDYIRENLKWEQQSQGIQPILIVGEKNISLQEKLKSAHYRVAEVDSQISKATTEKARIEGSISSKLTAEASRITKELGLGRNFRRPDFEELLSQIVERKQSTLSTEEYSVLLRTALSSNKLDSIDEISPDVDRNIISSAKELLRRVVRPSKTIERLRENPDIENWVRTGRDLHKGKAKCEFCQNDLPRGFLEVLDLHFSEDYEDFREEVELYYSKLKENTIELKSILKDKNDFYPELQKNYNSLRDGLALALKSYNDLIEMLLKEIAQKQSHLSQGLELDVNIKCDFASIEKAVLKFNRLIKENEKITSDFETARSASVEKIKRYYAGVFYGKNKYAQKQSRIAALEKKIGNLNKRRSAIGKSIMEMEAAVSESTKGAELLNHYMVRYFGHGTPIEIVAKDDGFHILRGEVEATNLSEGEKTAISFAHFLSTLQDKNTKDLLLETIVYVDDPISSLDSNHLYNTYSLISTSLKNKCGQLFISTHNFEFFNLLKDEFAYRRLSKKEKCDFDLKNNSECKSTLFQIVRYARTAGLSNMDCLLCRFKSEYQYLFEQLNRVRNSRQEIEEYRLYTMPNILRRFLETFVGFFYPSVESWKKNLWKLIIDDEERKFVQKIADEHSHSEDSDRAFRLYDTEEIRRAIEITFKAFEMDKHKKLYLDALKETIGFASP